MGWNMPSTAYTSTYSPNQKRAVGMRGKLTPGWRSATRKRKYPAKRVMDTEAPRPTVSMGREKTKA
jgi:hypothetical protein